MSHPQHSRYTNGNWSIQNQTINAIHSSQDTSKSKKNIYYLNSNEEYKSEGILNCEFIDSLKGKNMDKCKNSVSDQTNNIDKNDKNIKELDRNKRKVISSVETVIVRKEPRSKNENFHTALFSNKLDVPQVVPVKNGKRSFDDELNKCMESAMKKEQQQKKKKLSLQEYKLRRGVCSNNSSAQISPKTISPDRPSHGLDEAVKCLIIRTPPNGLLNTTDKVNTTLISNKTEVQIHQLVPVKDETRPFNDELNKCMEAALKTEQPQKKKRLSFQEYKLKRGVCANNSSAQISPVMILPEKPNPYLDEAVKYPITQTPPNGLLNTTNNVNNKPKFFDPISEASKKIINKIINSKKQKAEAMRKKDEDIVKNRLSKRHNLPLEPLTSDAEVIKQMRMIQPEVLTVLNKNKSKLRSSVEPIVVKEEPRPKIDNFCTALFNKKTDVQKVVPVKQEIRPFNDELDECMEAPMKKEQSQKKKKISFQEYKLRRGICSNNSSAPITPEKTSPEKSNPGQYEAVKYPITRKVITNREVLILS